MITFLSNNFELALESIKNDKLVLNYNLLDNLGEELNETSSVIKMSRSLEHINKFKSTKSSKKNLHFCFRLVCFSAPYYFCVINSKFKLNLINY